jgi:hypothetical protein
MTEVTTTGDAPETDVATDEAADAEATVANGGGDDGVDELDFVEPVEPESPVKDRLLLPLLVPVLCMIAVALYTLNVSRVFLAGDSTSALVIASLMTIGILVGGAIISASPRLRTSSLAMVMGLVLVIVVSAGLLSLGPSLGHGEGTGGPLPQPSAQAAATVTVEALTDITFDAEEYPTQAGVVEVDLTGASGHTLQFRELNYEGFPLSTDGGPNKGKVTLKPGEYYIYCTITGHEATMHANIIAT